MRGRKLNAAGKVLLAVIMLLVLFVAGSGIYILGSKVFEAKKNKTATTTVHEDEQSAQPVKKEDTKPIEVSPKEVIYITLDEWIGWKSLLDANGGLTTKPGSIYDKKGLNIEFIVSNDAVASSNMLIKGDTHGAGYTVNRYAFLNQKFKQSKVPVKMVYITKYCLKNRKNLPF